MKRKTRILALLLSCVLSLASVMNVYAATPEEPLVSRDVEIEKDEMEKMPIVVEESDMENSENEIQVEENTVQEAEVIDESENVGGTQDGFGYVIDGVKECAKITGYSGILSDVIVPSSIEGYPVKSIGGFSNNLFIEKVTVSDSVDIIENGTFAGCENLKEVKLPGKLSKLGEASFSGCISLENVNLPDSLQVIFDGTFKSCEKLQNIAKYCIAIIFTIN
ncbi:MAG: leucine-rich repeat domain-containing protein [Lachnospiraceae bacterium]|nr:leucine-rich repeat domain-containing protein [Lachnospiraceae bacterium]